MILLVFGGPERGGTALAQPGGQFFAAGSVEIELDRFGVGDIARAGEYAGVRLALRDSADRIRRAVVRLHMRDVDGDTVYIEREVTLNPGRRQFVWLYPLLPFATSGGSALPVTVHELNEDDDVPIVGRQIGAARIGPRAMPRESTTMLGIVGRYDMGLSRYSVRPSGSEYPGTAHELTEVISDLSPESMPDLWLGLASFESLIWVDGRPEDLTIDAAAAIREWVHRGGHMVIVIPPAGETWTNERNNPLFDIMPRAELHRLEGVNYERYRLLLTNRDVSLPADGVAHTFTPMDDAAVAEATPILRGSDGRAVVIRRAVGGGMVTMVGLDLADRRLAPRIDADVFWHRILGKRFDAFSRSEMDELRQTLTVTDFLNRTPVWLDDPIGAEINMTGRAGAGLLLALIIFGVYLLLQGPIGYGLLKMRSMQRHAWVVFLFMASLFTLIAWGGATTLRPRQIEGRHVTFIDHVYGQSFDRTRSWFSVLLPTYGEQVVELGPQVSPGSNRWTNALSVWDNPVNLAQRRFPDARSYAIEMSSPDRLEAPARSTVKQFRADWLGGPPWPMPQPVGGEITYDRDAGLSGVLTHTLPEALENVRIVLVRGQKPLQEYRGVGPLLFDALAWARTADWAPGDPLDLSGLVAPSLGDAWLDDLAGHASRFSDARGGGVSTADLQSAPRRFMMITWAPLLAPPDWQALGGAKLLLQRRSTHMLDLGKWLTQPCLIVVGQVSDGPSPTPLLVDGAPVEMQGRTIVRWIYPLAGNAPSPGRR